MRTVFQYTFLLFTIACAGICAYGSYHIGRRTIQDFLRGDFSYVFDYLFEHHIWILPIIGVFSIFALILEIKFLIFDNSKTNSEQLDDILIEQKSVFNIRKRYKFGYTLFCFGLLIFGSFIAPYNSRNMEFGSEKALLISIPVFFAIAGFIYFRDILKKQKEA